ncbi:MAG: penicillin acylase family protein [Gemmatimonadota bacterium]|nr:MAG: penicillin acylase family protein [Gemmatimonadota bacterium]
MRVLQKLRVGLAAILLGCGLYVGSCGIGSVAPLGPLLDPARGIWSLARSARLPDDAVATIASLDSEVRVVYDRRAVPHIFASSVDDAVRALGYVVARDRLFQLEIQTRATAGRLAEWAGRNALRTDRFQRSLGLARSAEREFAALGAESTEMRLLRAYAEGVRAWTEQIRPEDLPFEYRFLGTQPLRWEPVYSLYLMKRMGYTLAYSTHDLTRRRLVDLIGSEATDALFPVNSPIQEPIQPNGLGQPRFDFEEPVGPGVPRMRELEDVTAAVFGSDGNPVGSVANRAVLCLPFCDAETALASNNWAVSPGRSADGHALLSGDPHLNLSLPSIWYEAHMVVPGELDVYGVTIPGSPGIVIGFNRDVAWSFTNTVADVLDYFREVVDDPVQPSRYWLDDEWRPLESSVEEFYGSDGELLAVDTLYFTHRGPLVREGSEFLSVRWTVLDESGATRALFEAARSGSVEEWLSAMSVYRSPAQNGIVADRAGNIAIMSIGAYPIRAGSGDGTEIRDGTRRANDWQGYWPLGSYPFALNPVQGFLASANQQPLDPRTSGRYLGVNWPSPWRALRINALLRADSQVTPDAMRRYHTDPGNAKADFFVPAFLRAADSMLAVRTDSQLGEAARLLGEWDRRYTKGDQRAVLFEAALSELERNTWDELQPRGGGRRVATPTQAVLAQLVSFPENEWWDNVGTFDVVETRDEILALSLRNALQNVRREFGPPQDGGWRWDRVQQANIYHLLGFAALSALDLPVQGGPGSLNPSSGRGTFGASWRMVVQLGPEVTAWATYPGGQSGNPASGWYDNRIPIWVAGELEEVLFPVSADRLKGNDAVGSFTLRPGGD